MKWVKLAKEEAITNNDVETAKEIIKEYKNVIEGLKDK